MHSRCICLAAGLLAISTGTARAAPPTGSERELLRAFALARCLAHALPDEGSRADAARSAAGYLDAGSSGPEAYRSLEDAAAAAAARPAASHTGRSIATLTCIEFARSKALDALLTRLAPQERSRRVR